LLARAVLGFLGLGALSVAPPALAVGPSRSKAPVAVVVPDSEDGAILRLRSLGEIPALPEIPEILDLSELPEIPPLPALAPEGWLGVGLQCSDCSISIDEKSDRSRWRFRTPPRIYSVDSDSPAGRAGVREGDVITHLDGVKLTSADGGKRFGAVAPGDTVRWTIERDGKPQTVTMIAASRPHRDDREEIDALVNDQLRATLEDLQRQRDRLGEERARILRLHDAASKRHLAELERSIEKARRDVERYVERARRSAGRFSNSWGDDDLPTVVTPSPRSRKLRYEGTVGGSRVEVRGAGSVVVSEESGGDEIVITTSDATIRIQKSK
jgi:hypothetical protein